MLTDSIEGYLAVRRAAGFEMTVDAGLLRSFAKFAADRAQFTGEPGEVVGIVAGTHVPDAASSYSVRRLRTAIVSTYFAPSSRH